MKISENAAKDAKELIRFLLTLIFMLVIDLIKAKYQGTLTYWETIPSAIVHVLFWSIFSLAAMKIIDFINK